MQLMELLSLNVDEIRSYILRNKILPQNKSEYIQKVDEFIKNNKDYFINDLDFNLQFCNTSKRSDDKTTIIPNFNNLNLYNIVIPCAYYNINEIGKHFNKTFTESKEIFNDTNFDLCLSSFDLTDVIFDDTNLTVSIGTNFLINNASIEQKDKILRQIIDKFYLKDIIID